MRTAIEVIPLPVSDVDRAVRFYVDQVGFTLDVDYSPKDTFRVVQLTPPGSSCSIQVGRGLTDAPAGSVRNIYLVVSDIEAARRALVGRGWRSAQFGTRSPLEPGMEVSHQGSTLHTETMQVSPASPIRMATPGCCRNEDTAKGENALGRGLQGRGRGFDKVAIRVPNRSSGRRKEPSAFPLIPISCRLLICCHDRILDQSREIDPEKRASHQVFGWPNHSRKAGAMPTYRYRSRSIWSFRLNTRYAGSDEP
jgi:predicted enzyme related to lactoylglutathione lyase